MTWTVFTHKHGLNETKHDSAGRGGYSKVLVPLPKDEAITWFNHEYDRNPVEHRPIDPHEPQSGVAKAWEVEEFENPDDARAECGTMELDRGGIGVPFTRLYTWNELNGRLDIRVVTADEL